MRSISNKLTWITLFSVAMGFLETAVVIYLRKMYYPNGFSFPLVPIGADIARVEFLREAATVVMLIGIGVIAGRTPALRFAYFIYCFAIWDIFYYVFLKLFINWPASFFTCDILFLIPIPWVGPVLAPCILSITMCLLALVIIYYSEKGYAVSIAYKEWRLLIFGSLVVLFSFTKDYLDILFMKKNQQVWTLAGKQSMFNEMNSYILGSYNWCLFLIGELVILYSIYVFIRRIKNSRRAI
ncbi:MAG TPA: hypothetical protein VK559_07345 [Ferruginibacter sp.]|nr:hypothetical protein [Ferruginibacter sp.]